MSVELPPELWLRIFQGLQLRSIRSCHMVSILFSDLTRCFLFENFIFSPPPFTLANTALVLWALERLNFWSSDDISPYVHRCTINLLAIAAPMSVVTDSPRPLVSACLEAISRFTKLRELAFILSQKAVVEVPAIRADALQDLKTLRIHGARLARPSTTLTPIRLKIHHFSYTRTDYIHFPIVGAQTPRYSYLACFDPGTLRRLCLRSQELHGIYHFFDDRRAIAAFKNLHVLEIVFETATIDDLYACISSFPAIRELTLRTSRLFRPNSLPLTSLAPHLHTFNGSPQFLPAILLGRSLENLTISDGSTAALLVALQAAGTAAPRSIASLTMTIYYPELTHGPVMCDILSFFPNLRSLNLSLDCTEPSSPAVGKTLLFERLKIIFGMTPLLEEVSLEWYAEGEGCSAMIPRAEHLEEALLPALPSLRHISCRIDSTIVDC
ncbi:hypothetical protein C8R47DRAFT_1219010 [Mycena vitilis]|nr:hypothetical protein C8R47DRAFT_1219010 [Mycena vitilis]